MHVHGFAAQAQTGRTSTPTSTQGVDLQLKHGIQGLYTEMRLGRGGGGGRKKKNKRQRFGEQAMCMKVEREVSCMKEIYSSP